MSLMPVRILAGACLAAACALPQVNTISARPGAVNYVEGEVSLSGRSLSGKTTTRTFLASDDTLSTGLGKAEVLLTPGVFLRLGSNSELRMVSPRLTDTSVEVTKGEAMLEVSELVQDDNIHILDHGAAVKVLKIGLYRFQAGDAAVAQVLDGKASVELNGKQIELSKGKQLPLASGETKAVKFNRKDDDDALYAWSKVRDEYVAAASYSTARNVSTNSYYDVNGFGYNGFGGFYGPGWLWNSGFNSYAWIPGDGAFFSPFGFGYYAPGFVGYAPVVYAPVVYGNGSGVVTKKPVPIPVNPTKPVPVAGAVSRPMYANGSPARGSWAFAGVPANGGHVSSSSFASARAASAAPSSSAGAGGGYARSSAPSASPSMSASHASSGGGSHK